MGDLSAYPLDGPVPEPEDAQVRSIAKNLLALARRDNLTIRQLYTQVAAGFGTRVVIGTPRTLLMRWSNGSGQARRTGSISVHLCFLSRLDDFVRLVVPELRRRGMFRHEYEGTTLRQNLGLPMPRNRYATAAM